MKIERLDIENFRGVRGTYEFEPDGDNAIIVGPNGSGKSSVLEAINYLLTNKVGPLSQDGMGSVDKNEVIPNVDAGGDCVVSGVFANGDSNSSVEVVRAFDSNGLEPSEDDLPDSLQQTFGIARQGQHILTRADLLDLIIARPSSRREVLSELLDLPDIDERRLVLKRSRQNIDEKHGDATASRQTTAKRLRDLTESDASEHHELRAAALESITELRDSFDGDPVDEIDPETVRDGIKSPVSAVSTEALQRERPREELEKFAAWLDQLEAELPEELRRLEERLQAVRDQESSEVNASQLELLELGEEVISPDAGTCPLCKQAWTDDISLLEDVRERRSNLRKLNELIDELDQQQTDLRSRFEEGIGYLDYLHKELEEDTYPAIDELSTLAELLAESSELLSGDILGNPDFEPHNLPFVDVSGGEIALTIDDSIRATDSLRATAEELDDLDDTEQRYERIKSIADQWQEYDNLDATVDRLDSLRADVKTAESAFKAARKEVIGEIYDDITDRVERYYGTIHPDESNTETSLIVTDTGTEIQREFYDAGEYHPQSVFSEGHLDSLGLCLHLALADYLQQDEKSLLLLDDVVMSVDQDHRLEIAKLIADEFAEDYQVIITTHDELWAEQLSSQGALYGGSRISLREWSYDGGISESRSDVDVYEQWETVQEARDHDEMERAAHELRYATERMLQQCAISLGAKVDYDPRLQHTLGDFKDAVCHRLNTLTGKAKDNLDPSDDMFDRANELDNSYGLILNNVGQQLNTVNRRVHWTPGKWLTLRPEEFEEVFEAHKKAYDLLYCDECGSSIRYEEFDGYCELRCNCREHYDIQWN